jgi:hypothetical protein
VKEKRLRVSEKMVVVVLLVSLFISMERRGIHSKTNLGTSMRAIWRFVLRSRLLLLRFVKTDVEIKGCIE